ncbi:MAG: hypothetical protein AMK72_14340 [Planctomycetes bacterium SM23_25]|nr:MAG: hypothetical protein AMK72_14340 [Planctomycetes bacterium SM23_25]
MQVHEELLRRERELRRRVDEVLFYVWDPIGVSNDPCARGEYTGYVAAVLDRMTGDDAEASVSAYLLSVMTDSMGLAPDEALCKRAAEMLMKHKRAVENGLA